MATSPRPASCWIGLALVVLGGCTTGPGTAVEPKQTTTTTSVTFTSTSAVDGGEAEPSPPVFETLRLSEDFYAEGADVGDIDGDGVLDLVGGPRWFAGPDFALAGRLFDAPSYSRDEYSTFFLTFVDDLNADGRADVIAIGNPGAGSEGGSNAFWYENPGSDGLNEEWVAHALFDGLVSNESPAYVDLVADEAKELVFMTDGRLGYAQRVEDPTAPWTFQPVSDQRFDSPFEHGLGVGDIDSDGLADIVERNGWWQQPEGENGWTFHAVDFGVGLEEPRPANWGGAQMHVIDVDGDGDSDVVTVLAAHAYGLSWFEQTETGSFVAHEILPAAAGAGNVSQLHALAVGDIDDDGLTDLITGKRYYAHPSSSPDPGTTEPAVIMWLRLDRDGAATFVPELIDDDSGVGLNFAVRDVNEDGKLDVFVSNKRGTFLHRQR